MNKEIYRAEDRMSNYDRMKVVNGLLKGKEFVIVDSQGEYKDICNALSIQRVDNLDKVKQCK